MPIIRNLRKDFDEGRMDGLRSLKYEDSGVKAPYITKPEGSSFNELTKRVDDTSRIAQMLIDKPGLKYLANEGILRQGEIRRKTQAAADKKRNQKGGATAAGVFLAGVGGALEGTVAAAGQILKIVGSTLAQVPVNGTGTHFVRGFNTDSYINGYYGFGSVNASARALKGEQVILNNDGSDGYNVLFPKNKSDLADRQSTLTEKKSHDTQKWTDESTYTKTNTDENRANVVDGAHVNKSDLLENNTTASPGDLGTAIQSANEEGSLSGFSIRSETKNTNEYNPITSYTATDTKDNVNNVTNGQSIPKPDDLLRNTTPSDGSLGIDKKDIEGTIPENVDVAQGNYRSDTPYTEKSTEDNVINANTGVPINNPSGTGEFDQTFAIQTTSLEGAFGITNKAIEGDITDPLPERSQIITFDNGQLEAGGGRTATSTKANINRSRVGAVIPLLGAPTRPADDLYQKGIRTLFNLEDEQFKEYINTGYGPVEDRKKLIDLNTGEDGTGIGTITSLPKQFEQKFIDVEGARYLDSTENNSIAAQVGVPISNKNLYGNSPINTTDLKGSPIYGKSIENRGIVGDITGLYPKFENTYKDGGRGSSYLAHSTLSNINAVQSGIDFIDPNGQYRPADGGIPIRSNSWIDGIKFTSKRITDTRVKGDVNSIGLEGEYFSGNARGDISTFDKNKSSTAIQDFRATDSTKSPGMPLATDNYSKYREQKVYAFDYNSTTINKETRVGLGNPGKKTRNKISYGVYDEDTVDKLNMLDVSTEELNAGAIPAIGTNNSRDLIQLEFQVLTPEQTYYLGFRAFLETFDDSFNGSWNTHKYLGRAENFYTYSGFERSINIGFKIAAQSQDEMEPLYRKAATLASVTAPTYGQGGRFMRGSIAKVTVGDYIYEQPGIIESVQYTWQKDYPWEISFENPETKNGKGPQILPHVLDVSISFKVIHDFLPETGTNPFITNYKADKQNKKVYIPLENREFTIPESNAEKRERLAKEEAVKKEAAAKAKVIAENKEFRETGASGPLQEVPGTTEPAETPFTLFQ